MTSLAPIPSKYQNVAKLNQLRLFSRQRHKRAGVKKTATLERISSYLMIQNLSAFQLAEISPGHRRICMMTWKSGAKAAWARDSAALDDQISRTGAHRFLHLAQVLQALLLPRVMMMDWMGLFCQLGQSILKIF
jgi:hypothetical protein